MTGQGAALSETKNKLKNPDAARGEMWNPFVLYFRQCRVMRDLVTEMNANDLVTLVTDQTRVTGTPDGHLSPGERHPRL